jgi:hypothetical protein
MDSDETKRLLSRLRQMSGELTKLEQTCSLEAIPDKGARLQILGQLQYIISVSALAGMHIAEGLQGEVLKV